MFDIMSEMLPTIQKLQDRKLDVKNLTVSTMDHKDGVIIQLTSPDPDGKYMSEVFGKLFAVFPKMLEGQGVRVTTLRLDEEGNVKE